MPSPVASRQTRIMSEQWMGNNNPVKVVNATTALLVQERVVDVQTIGASYNITLPAVAEADGITYQFFMSVRTSTFNATIQHKGDSLGWTDLVMDGVGDNLLLYSDGQVWHPTKIGVA